MRGGTLDLDTAETHASTEQSRGSGSPHPISSAGLKNSSSESTPDGPISENVVRQGQVIDRYRIVRLIASGGMSRVYEAVHAFTNKAIALKVMRARYSDRQDVISRFRHEAMALSSIHHPNVVNVENAGLTDDGHVFIAMELLNGRNLREVLGAKKSLGVRESLELVASVAMGVAAAHAVDVIHRDLKPENIFCVDALGPKVLDLGTAKFAGDNVPTTQTAHGKIVGTAAYVAPERLNGETGDERCDVYSLGLVLYECIAGFHPMAPEGTWPSASEIASRQISFSPRPVPGLSEAVSAIISKAIQKNPDKRYCSMLEFSEAIYTVLPAIEARPSSFVPPRKGHRPRTVVFPIVLGAVIGTALGGGAFVWWHSPPRARARLDLDVRAPALQSLDNQAEPGINSAPPPGTPSASSGDEPAAPIEGSSARPEMGAPSGKVSGKPTITVPPRPRESLPAELATSAERREKVNAGVAATPQSPTYHAERVDLPASGL